jgi:hypothetical protein
LPPNVISFNPGIWHDCSISGRRKEERLCKTSSQLFGIWLLQK